MKTFSCPNCNAQLTGKIENGRTTCPYCRTIVIVDSNGNRNEVRDPARGITIATAECPDNFILGGALDENLQSSINPLTTFVFCESADQKTKFFYESGKAFQHILKHMLIPHREGQMEQNYTIPMAKFQTTKKYIDSLAVNFAGDKPIKFIKEMKILPTENIDRSIPRVVQVEMELQATQLSYGVETTYDEPLTRIYQIDGKYFLLSTTVLGIKWFVNAPDFMPSFDQMAEFGKKIGKKLNSSGLFGNKQTAQEEVKQEPKKQNIADFMKTPTKGKAVSFTNWWVPCLFGMWSEKMPDEKTLRDFSIFASTVKESDIIAQRRYEIQNQYINNIYMAVQQEQANVNAFVANSQADIHRRQMQISQSISQRNDIINSGYANRVAAQDRMRQKTSEAIRGVDTYQTSSGTTEFKTGAKRVVQKNNDPKSKVEIGYLDSVPDGWTEIFKQ